MQKRERLRPTVKIFTSDAKLVRLIVVLVPIKIALYGCGPRKGAEKGLQRKQEDA